MQYERLLKPRTKELRQNATIWRRTGALLIDVLVIDIVLTGPFTPLLQRLLANPLAAYTRTEFAAVVGMFLLAYGYFVLFEYVLGQTVGMMVLGLRTARQAGPWEAGLRNCYALPLFPFVFLWVIEPFMLSFTGKTLLERLTGIRTIRSREVII